VSDDATNDLSFVDACRDGAVVVRRWIFEADQKADVSIGPRSRSVPATLERLASLLDALTEADLRDDRDYWRERCAVAERNYATESARAERIRVDVNVWLERAEKAEAKVEQMEHDAIAVLSILADCEDDEPLCNAAGDAYVTGGIDGTPRRILTVGMVRQMVGVLGPGDCFLCPADCDCGAKPERPHTHGGPSQETK
jgi:hypothetical protein